MRQIRKTGIALLLAAAMLFALTACKKTEKQPAQPSETAAPAPFSMDAVRQEIDSRQVSDFTETDAVTDYVKLTITGYGELVIRLRPDVAPISAENFQRLVAKGYYNGKLFHRVYPGFMIQGGSEKGDGMPGSEPTIKGEFSANGVSNPLLHVRGVISMARATPKDSGSTQFFLMHADSDILDGNYAAFGYIVAGLETVDNVCTVELTMNGRERSKPVTPVILESAAFVTPNK